MVEVPEISEHEEKNLPRWQRNMLAKHRAQIEAHEKKYGPLGEPMRYRAKKVANKKKVNDIVD